MAPSKHIAAVVIQGGSVELKPIDVPKPGPNEALVKIAAASLNPTDWKTAQRDTSLGNVSGCDFSGVVEELGPGADAFLKVGQRVTTFVPGARSNNSNGAYAQYVVTKADVCVTIPDNWSFETAAQLPIAVFTACQCLYQSLPFSVPPASSAPIEDSILIYGASSSVGTYVVQLAKITGLKVYATCSPKNFDLVRGFGADEVYDYRDPDAPKKIRDATGGKLRYAVDTISEHGSSEFISGVLAEDLDGMKIACILPFEGKPRENVELVLSVAYDLITPRPDSVLRLEDGPKYAKLVTTLLAEGKLKPAPVLVMPNGLGSVNDGFKYMMDGKVSAQKVIFRIADTDGLLQEDFNMRQS